MYVRDAGDLRPASTDRALAAVREAFEGIARDGGTLAGILSPFLTVEEAYLLATYLKELSPSSVLALGPVPSSGEDVTFTPDPRAGRTGDTSFVVCRPFTIHAEKCPNVAGVVAILEHFQGEVIDYEVISRRVGAGEFRGVYVTSDAIDPAFTEADVEPLRKAAFLVVQDVHATPLAQAADVVLAGATFAEKAGCYVNFQGRLQYAAAALPPREGSLPDLDLLTILIGRGAGPIRSADVLAELAAMVPAFAPAADGNVPPFGVLLGPEHAGDGKARGAFIYRDPWFATRREREERPLSAPVKQQG
jgi:NADH-quinone oxidoreductase subunit G